MKRGVLGGTFDPPHLGHLALARAALEQLDLEEVVVVPAGRNPLKTGRGQSPKADRFAMARLLFGKEPRMAVSDLEITRQGPSYGIDTLMELQAIQPGDYWFILGADAVREFESWKQPERFARLARLAVATRGVHGRDDLAMRLPEWLRPSIDWLDLSPIDISSTDLRARVARGLAIDTWVGPDVARYVTDHRLYRS